MSENRAEAHGLARTLEAAGNPEVEDAFAQRAKRRAAKHPPLRAILEFIETEAHAVHKVFTLKDVGEPQSAR